MAGRERGAVDGDEPVDGRRPGRSTRSLRSHASAAAPPLAAANTAVAAFGIGGLVLLARHDPITKSNASTDQAITAALAATRCGHATEVERVTDDGATWEVDVVKRDGIAVDIRLDRRFGLVAIEEEVEDADGP